MIRVGGARWLAVRGFNSERHRDNQSAVEEELG